MRLKAVTDKQKKKRENVSVLRTTKMNALRKRLAAMREKQLRQS
jgi:hypothetical protein